MKNVKYYNSHNIPLSLRNLYFRNECSVTEILDIVEDANTVEELINGLNSLRINIRFNIDRTTEQYVRLKGIDAFGNIHYLKAYKE